MPEQLRKLSPHRDLQCYFYTPSAIASISGACESGFTLSGAWRQQFDWAVVEWNRDNVFEHPALRYLPDGDLSGIQLTYLEQRINCIPFESNLFPTTDWPYLRLWATGSDGVEHVYFVPLLSHAIPSGDGRYKCASGSLTLMGTPKTNDRVGIAMPVAPAASGYPEQHYFHEVQEGDNLATIASGVALAINAGSADFLASSQGATVHLVWNGSAQFAGMSGANGNRITVYGFSSPGAAARWSVSTVTLAGGSFPATYSVSLNFGSLMGYRDQAGTDTSTMVPIPTGNVRKMRWTWAADLQPASFLRTEFQVLISGWQVSGSKLSWEVAGPGSRRIEDNDSAITYTSGWNLEGPGNYSGNTIHLTQTIGDVATIAYAEGNQHLLFLGTRLLTDGADILISIDGGAAQSFSLAMAGEDTLVRIPLGTVGAGSHSVSVLHNGPAGGNLKSLFVDFLEICYPSTDLPEFPPQPSLALATDYDTYHSQSLAPERTAWIVQKLGFRGRVNHYLGALWFYELVLPGHIYNSVTVTLSTQGSAGSGYIEISIGPVGLDPGQRSVVRHYNLPDDTAETATTALANVINQGYTAIWASAQSNVLTITSRQLTSKNPDANSTLSVSVTRGSGSFTGVPSGETLSGGSPGTPYDDAITDEQLYPITQYWRTDTAAGINRAARDWSQAYFTALKSYGLDAVAAFSTEMKNADPGVQSGLAQRRIDGSPVLVNTPAVQTNFSPISTGFWTQIYLDMAALQTNAGLSPYLQFGEVQWWYFPWNQEGEAPVSMPFYDSYTQQQFIAAYDIGLSPILTNDVDPADYPKEASFLPSLIGAHTTQICAAVRSVYPQARFEVLYPTDTNASSFNQQINYPPDWNPSMLNCLKTENFTYTYARNLDAALSSMRTSASKGFANGALSHLVGIGDATSPWAKEVDLAQSQGMESVVLFALDQFCLIGYPTPPFIQQARSQRLA